MADETQTQTPLVKMELTQVEYDIIMDLRLANPFEEVRITKDKGGQYDSYLFISTQKKMYQRSKPKI